MALGACQMAREGDLAQAKAMEAKAKKVKAKKEKAKKEKAKKEKAKKEMAKKEKKEAKSIIIMFILAQVQSLTTVDMTNNN
jgi:FtsZ-interacting cell division protein ZipA